MIIKKFTGKTEAEATEAAKKELGSGVVIMNVRQIKPKGLLAAIKPKLTEVTAAMEEEPDRSAYVRKESAPARTVAPVTAAPLSGGTRSIEEKLENLQTLLESQLKLRQQESTQPEAEKQNGSAAAVRREEPEQSMPEEPEQTQEESEQDSELKKFSKLIYDTLLENEVDEKYAGKIMEEMDKIQKPNMPFDYLLASIYQRMILKFGKTEENAETGNGPRTVIFIGPTGVGKTTTIAKIASRYAVEQKKKVALLTMDTYRIAAAEQLRTYANILMVPFRVVYTEEELLTAIQDFQNYDYILMDTAGHSPQNKEQLAEMKQLLSRVKKLADCHFYLVLSATTKYKDLMKIADSYRQIAEYKLIFTKLDETEALGNLLNLRLYTDAGIAYVTCGQNVPDDIEVFNPQKTVKQLLGGGRQ
ncbi:MAG: flagellar biosynthesis protein FlhF [bacterium]|nr:flagellar biosynthesis protein FlhF [bacterium]MCM1375626.1 flagellar biosynthesis protein FlhF [Muribaculum sp.]